MTPPPTRQPGQNRPRGTPPRTAQAPHGTKAPPKAPSASQAPRRSPPPRRQTPPPLTAAQKRAWKEQQARKRRLAWRNFRFYAVSVLVVYLVFALIFLLGIFLKLNSFPKVETQHQNVFFADEEQNEFSSELAGTLYKTDKLVTDDILYLEVDLLSHYTLLSEGGNSKLRTLYIGGESALFYLGSTTVCINGQYSALSAPAILRNSRLCVPLDFFSDCLRGIQVEADGENGRHVIRKISEIDFAFEADEEIEPLDYNKLQDRLNDRQSK